MPKPINLGRSVRAGTLTIDALKAVIQETVRGKFAGGSVGKQIKGMIAIADELLVDLFVHEGDLVIDGDLRMGQTNKAGLLVVKGSLDVRGLLTTTLDPDTVLVVTRDVRAHRMISSGFLEVGGSIVVQHEALWMDNDGCAEIFGDLRAGVLYTQYHAVKVHGVVDAPLIFGDEARFESPKKYTFVDETDDAHKHMLRARLPAKALSIEGDPSDDEDWCIDCVNSEVLVRMVTANQRILREPA